MLRFTCGCSSLIEVPIPNVVNGDGEKGSVKFQQEYLKTFDAVAFDAEGFIICAIHRQRRAGWRSVPYTATTVPVPGAAAWTELQYEAWFLYGQLPKPEKMPESVFIGSVEDRRFNDDPNRIGEEISRHLEIRRDHGESTTAKASTSASWVLGSK